ncbi:MAG: protein-L-isoaspartate(D-aspartate) O-methyltransferase [Myxococcales bacterium]|nr:protein-L-isoaspartate(D-aspartate) O-methyltransferase [Myxococcota bacterium]MDW8284452.1 protein-L-isoaspartate(D-aspartate) O-methyltransferase [Myxococcales bacterium]
MSARAIWQALLGLLLLTQGECMKRNVADGSSPPASTDLQAARRQQMVADLRQQGIRDESVLRAMSVVPRHRFVPERLQGVAYEDSALPIEHGQTISQPFVVAHMTELLQLKGRERVLEIGTGSGYQAAVLAELAGEVYSIEIVPELAAQARRLLAELGYTKVHVRQGDGYLGWPEQAPFDRILLTAAPEEVPQTLIDQLAMGGRLVAPVGGWAQEIVVLDRKPEGITRRTTIPVRFVPMVHGR